jgi:hypothetical protein
MTAIDDEHYKHDGDERSPQEVERRNEQDNDDAKDKE